MNTPLRVHIIPVGDDLVERIVTPTKESRPDRVYLVTFQGKSLFRDVFNQVKRQFTSQKLLQPTDIWEVECNFYNFTEVLQTYAKIIRQEQQAGNFVFFNVSTGGKLNSLAGMLACLLFGSTPYFCKADFETGRIPDPPELIQFPRYHIDRPPLDLVQFLLALQHRGTGRTNPYFTKGECLEVMHELNPDLKVSGKTSGDYNKLKFRYIDKLLERNYVSIDSGPRGKIAITEEGKFAISIFSAYYFG